MDSMTMELASTEDQPLSQPRAEQHKYKPRKEMQCLLDHLLQGTAVLVARSAPRLDLSGAPFWLSSGASVPTRMNVARN